MPPQIPRVSTRAGGVLRRLADDAGRRSRTRGPSWAPAQRRRIGSGRTAGQANGRNGAAAAAGRLVSLEAARRDARFDPRPDADPRLSRARPPEANLDPLGLEKREPHPELDPRPTASPRRLDRPIFIDNVLGLRDATMREIVLAAARPIAARSASSSCTCQDPDQKAWIQERIESARNQTEFTPRARRAILERLTAAEIVRALPRQEVHRHQALRLEGAEAMIPALEQIIKRGGQLGVRELVSACRIAAASTCSPTSWASRSRDVLRVSRATARTPRTCRARATSSTTSARHRTASSTATSSTSSLTANPSHLEA
jgi:2-oxoglutarate dehydrogenase E1 component